MMHLKGKKISLKSPRSVLPATDDAGTEMPASHPSIGPGADIALEALRPPARTVSSSALSTIQAHGSPEATLVATPNPEPASGEPSTELPTDEGTAANYGPVVIFSVSTLLFFAVGTSYCWGLLSANLLSSSLRGASASTAAFIGSTSVAGVAFFAILNGRIVRLLGSRKAAMLGSALMGLGQVLSSFTTSSVGGLFVTTGLVTGYGISLCFMVSTVAPSQYYRSKRGLAGGIVFASGGVGGAIFSFVIEGLLDGLGAAWTFRVLGLITLGVTVPASWLLRDRVKLRDNRMALVEWSLFKDVRFVAVFVGGGIGTFPLFIAPFFVPTYASNALHYSSSKTAGLVAGWNIASAAGRLGFGYLCDSIGPLNSLIIALIVTAISMLAIWPVSESLAPLLIFCILNGASNGAFFSCMPTAISTLFTTVPVPVSMGMAVTSWAAGYLMGPPVAGYLLDAYGGQSGGLSAYRPAQYFGGSLALASAGFLLLARRPPSFTRVRTG